MLVLAEIFVHEHRRRNISTSIGVFALNKMMVRPAGGRSYAAYAVETLG